MVKHVAGPDQDTAELVRAAPRWLLERNVAELSLTPRIRNVFRLWSIIRVSDIADFTGPELLRLPNFGRESLRHLAEALRSAVDRGPAVLSNARRRSPARETER